MINERIFLGYPIKFKDICKIYPPTVNDVIGDDDFSFYQSLLTITQEDLEDAYAQEEEQGFSIPTGVPVEGVPFNMRQQKPKVQVPTPFQYLLINCHQDEDIKHKVEEGFLKLTHEPVTIVPEIEMFLIGKSEDELDPNVDLDNPRLLTEENYFDFQNMVRTSLGDKPAVPPDPNEDPRVKRIKAKGRRRERIKARRGKGPTLGTLLAAICCMGIGLTPLNIGEMSYACVQWLISMYQQNEEYDIDIRSLLAGADSKKVKPKYWIKNLD